MTTLLHVSDLHFGPPFVTRVGDALLRVAPTLEPDAIVVTGDITQRATPRQFAEARDFFARMPDVPLIATPGNHDVPLRVWERIRRPHELYRTYIRDELNHFTHLPGVSIASLDSTAPHRFVSRGRLELEQLAQCEDALAPLPPEVVRVVATHHHFLPAPDYAWDRTIPKARRALDRLIALRVDVILGGHLHRAYIGNSLDVYRGADPEHGIVIVQCGTTTSRRGRGREREKNTFNLLRFDRSTIEVTHYMFFDELGDRFAPISRHHFPRPSVRVLDAAGDANRSRTSATGPARSSGAAERP